MIKYTRQPQFDTIENFLLSHQDKLYVTTAIYTTSNKLEIVPEFFELIGKTV